MNPLNSEELARLFYAYTMEVHEIDDLGWDNISDKAKHNAIQVADRLRKDIYTPLFGTEENPRHFVSGDSTGDEEIDAIRMVEGSLMNLPDASAKHRVMDFVRGRIYAQERNGLNIAAGVPQNETLR